MQKILTQSEIHPVRHRKHSHHYICHGKGDNVVVCLSSQLSILVDSCANQSVSRQNYQAEYDEEQGFNYQADA